MGNEQSKTAEISDANNSTASSAEQSDETSQRSASSEQGTSKSNSGEKELSVRDIVAQTVAASQADGSSDRNDASGSKMEPDGEGAEEPSGDTPAADANSADEFAMDKNEEEDSKLPFHEHPRWKEMVKQRNDFQQQMETVKPLVEAHNSVVDYCRNNNITPDKFQRALKIAALLENDPEAARAELTPIWEQLQGEVGQTLPQDLKDDVEAGNITEERAKEIASLRKKTERSTRQQQLSAQQQQQVQQQQFVQAATSAVQSWEDKTKTTNPDFAPKKDANQPDGAYEWWMVKLESLIRTKGIRTPADAVQLAEEAYKQVFSSVSRFKPASQGTRRSVSSTRSASNSSEKAPETIRDVVFATAKKFGAQK